MPVAITWPTRALILARFKTIWGTYQLLIRFDTQNFHQTNLKVFGLELHDIARWPLVRVLEVLQKSKPSFTNTPDFIIGLE